MTQMKIGGHVSSSGGFLKVFGRAEAIGANCFQTFVSSPRMWRVPEVDPSVGEQFKRELAEREMQPSYVHIKYLVNLVSQKPDVVEKSVRCIVEELKAAHALGLRGGMFHIGAHQGMDRDAAVEMLVGQSKRVLAQLPDDVLFILENSATDKKLGAKLEEVGKIVRRLDDPRVRVCLDTCHAFSAGYDLRDNAGVDKFVSEIEQHIGLDKLELIHVNDSKAAFDSNIDRHENIGKGSIGIEGFGALLNHPKLMDKPFILEVPGTNKSGPDKENVDALKNIVIPDRLQAGSGI
jgi:deoxyribonuclease-4